MRRKRRRRRPVWLVRYIRHRKGRSRNCSWSNPHPKETINHHFYTFLLIADPSLVMVWGDAPPC